MFFYWPKLLVSFLSSIVFPFLLYFYYFVLFAWGFQNDRVLIALSWALHCRPFFIIIITIIIIIRYKNVFPNHKNENMGSYEIEQSPDIHCLLKRFLYLIKRMNMGLYPALMS